MRTPPKSPVVRRSVTDVVPAALVPAAWTLVGLAHVTTLVSRQALGIALVVMTVLLGTFVVGTRDRMTGPVLGVWRGVLVLGFVITLVGAVDVLVTTQADPTFGVTLYGWMILPGLAYVATAQSVDPPFSTLYLASGIFSLAGAGTYAVAGSTVETTMGLGIVAVGQTLGIVAAVVQNPGTGTER